VELMAIKGSLKEASLPDVIQLLAMGKKTGCLAVADGQNFGYIYFRNGRIIYASIVNRRDRLGDILVKSGRILPEQLLQAVELQGAFGEKRLGQILVDTGAISKEDLTECVALQIEEAVYFLFTWDSGTFNFEVDVQPEKQDVLVSIPPESLLLEGARRVDEWSLIQNKIPSFDLIFEVRESRVAASAATLSHEQEQLLPLLDGRHDVSHVIDASGMGEFEVGKALFGLVTAGFIHRVGVSSTGEVARVNQGRIEEHRNLGIAFYRADMLDEAQREFRRVAELRPSDGSPPFQLGLIAIKQGQWEEAVEMFQRAVEKGGPRPSALHNLAFAMERQGRLAEAEATYADAVSKDRRDPRIMLGWGIAALLREDYAVASGRLARSRELLGSTVPPPTWYWAATLAHAGADDQAAALEIARAGVDAYPSSAVLNNNFAVLLELTGDGEGAKTRLDQAYTEEPTLPQVSKNLGDHLYRASKYEEAYDSYQRAAKLNPDLGDDLYFKLGNISYKKKDLEGAKGFWQRVIELNPGHELARSNLEMLESVS
jgi:tetratricopeptide (TPR) repeat protein